VELAREIAAAPPFDAYREEECLPGAHVRSAAGIEQHVRDTMTLLYHPCGTCRMGQDERSVVDPELRVHGLQGLFVGDASVMPTIPRGNTQSATVMIAERLASWLAPAVDGQRAASDERRHQTASEPGLPAAGLRGPPSWASPKQSGSSSSTR
jgi:choline dehydrogenase-like flavoprotein